VQITVHKNWKKKKKNATQISTANCKFQRKVCNYYLGIFHFVRNIFVLHSVVNLPDNFLFITQVIRYSDNKDNKRNFWQISYAKILVCRSL
jgi:hypothetical protein